MIDSRAIVVYLRYLKRDFFLALKAAFGIGDIQSWKRFHYEVRSKGCRLFRALGKFENSILVAGCQRSGTTILARIITQSDGMVNYPVRSDDELDAALILSGVEKHEPKGRYCFQTTYLNECYTEYFSDKYDYKLIWVIRNPFSVVYSMKYNWGVFAFNELFDACGYSGLDDDEKRWYGKYGSLAIPKTRRACLSYNGKQMQSLELMRVLGSQRMMVVDYDQMVKKKEMVLKKIYQFIDLPYHDTYKNKIHEESLVKAESLSDHDKMQVEKFCMPVYERVRAIATQF